MNAPVLDLLRQRRQELDLAPLSGVLRERRGLLRRGTLIGAGIVGAVAALCLGLVVQQQWLRSRMGPLERYEAEAASLQGRVDARRKSVEAIVASNRRLVGALTSLRTTSAVLADLQLRTPEGVQIRTAEGKTSGLLLKGQARDPMAMGRINALQLELQSSPLLEPDAMSLGRVERVSARDNRRDPALPPGSQPVAFEMSGPFASLEPSRQLEVLRALGADGIARRLELLQREGLLP